MMVTKWGMSDKVGLFFVDDKDKQSGEFQQLIDDEVTPLPYLVYSCFICLEDLSFLYQSYLVFSHLILSYLSLQCFTSHFDLTLSHFLHVPHTIDEVESFSYSIHLFQTFKR